MVECSVCHILYDCSARTARDIRAGRTEGRCMLHRKATERTVVARQRRDWLDRFSLDEIVVMGCAIYGRRDILQHKQELLASGHAPIGPPQ